MGIRKSGASVTSLVNVQTVTESEPLNRSSCTITTGPRLARVIAATRCNPQLAPVHPTSNSLIASIKA